MAFSFTSKDSHRLNIEINDLRQSPLRPPVARGPVASIGSHISRIREHAERASRINEHPPAHPLGPGPRRFGAPGEFSAELVAPATNRFVSEHDTTLEQQLLDVAQAEAEPKIPPNSQLMTTAGKR
jgi:hypothetical protein